MIMNTLDRVGSRDWSLEQTAYFSRPYYGRAYTTVLRPSSVCRMCMFNNLLSKAQLGFVTGQSTCTNLLECLNDWTLSVQNGKSVVVAYID